MLTDANARLTGDGRRLAAQVVHCLNKRLYVCCHLISSNRERLIVRKINKKTGEIQTIQPGGLYAPLPIPAYQVLARAKEFQAQRVLLCIVSHLGSNGFLSFPSYKTIATESGVGRNAIKRSLDILVEYGFIKVFTIREGKRKRNQYFVQQSAFNSGLMNKFARSKRTPTSTCLRCGYSIDRGGYGVGLNGFVHFGCGGKVVKATPDPNRPLKGKVVYLKQLGT